MFPIITQMPISEFRIELIADMEAGFTNPMSLLQYQWKPTQKPTIKNVVLGFEPVSRVRKLLK
jgi:hypothetical protein